MDKEQWQCNYNAVYRRRAVEVTCDGLSTMVGKSHDPTLRLKTSTMLFKMEEFPEMKPWLTFEITKNVS